MALTDERIGQLAMVALMDKIQKDGGLRLNPREIKRDIHNSAKQMGISTSEMAQFALIMIKTNYDKTVAEIESMINEGRV
jgi:hypothetical protein